MQKHDKSIINEKMAGDILQKCTFCVPQIREKKGHTEFE